MPRDSCSLNHKQRLHFNYASDGLGELTREDPLQLTSPTDENYEGPACNYSNNVIKVRVAKTVELLGRKTNLEYNFITPVPNYNKTAPTRDTRTAQYVPTLYSHCCSPC
ncbi:hypothetical protein EVAR_100901_1 [Eumeta japonica]|uniref:Uncharacterized protein n=1 Tax=Eumeta variegata TaxID=151549 RepID=A0A4C1SUR3_EUMVA|nr:hypothetical protein EVAR_100901_1 [Eumeta japonica]